VPPPVRSVWTSVTGSADRSVVEVFANRRQALAVRLYPGRADSTGISLRAQGSDTVVRSLDVWEMRSVWEG